MKISWVCPPLNFSGGIRVVLMYAHALQSRGHDVCIVEQPFTVRFRDYLRHPIRSYETVHRRKQFDAANFNIDKEIRLIRPQHNEFGDADIPDADCVIATFWTTASVVAHLSDAKGAKFYFMQDYGQPGSELEQIYKTWQYPLKIFTISDYLSNLVFRYTGKQDIVVVKNGVERRYFSSKKRRKNQKVRIGFVYRTGWAKGADIVFEAIRNLQIQRNDFEIISFGRVRPDVDIARADNFIFYHQPSDDEVSAIYRDCDAWIMPSRMEGFGLPILEAMAGRTPVISTPAGAANEILSSGGGLQMSTFSPTELADKISEILDMPADEWCKLSEEAYAIAHRYSWDTAVDKLEELLVQEMTVHKE